MDVNIRVPQLVGYDYWDRYAMLYDIRSDRLVEFSVRQSSIIAAALSSSSIEELLGRLSALQPPPESEEVLTLLKGLREWGLIEERTSAAIAVSPFVGPPPVARPSRSGQDRVGQPLPRPSFLLRCHGGMSIVSVTGELVQGIYKAYQYIETLEQKRLVGGLALPKETALQLAKREPLLPRQGTALVERRAAHLLGQSAKAEEQGPCFIRAFALCAYLLSLGIPARIVIARPMYSVVRGFKLHAWVEVEGEALIEDPNIRDGYRVMITIPSY